MIENPYIIPGKYVHVDFDDEAQRIELLHTFSSTVGYWHVQCPACGKIHERIVHRHWDDEQEGVVESHQIICMESKTTFFIEASAPFNVLRETKFGLTRDSKSEPDETYIVPF